MFLGAALGGAFGGAVLVILPVILTVVLATAVRAWLSPATIYTLKLLRRGAIAPLGLEARMGGRTCAQVMTSDFRLLSREEAGDPGIVREAILNGQVVVVGGEDGRIGGVIDERSRLEAGDYIVVDPGQAFDAALRAINEAGARLALVARNDAGGEQKLLGVITERAIAQIIYAATRLAE